MWKKGALIEVRKSKKEVPPRLELGSLDSKSRVLTITPWDQFTPQPRLFASLVRTVECTYLFCATGLAVVVKKVDILGLLTSPPFCPRARLGGILFLDPRLTSALYAQRNHKATPFIFYGVLSLG